MSYGIVSAAYDEPCHFLDEVHRPDGEGGILTEWEKGASFMAAVVPQSSALDRIANQVTGSTTAVVMVSKSVTLDFHSVFQNEKTGEIYRVTSQTPQDTPKTSNLDMRKVTAERWELPA